jgi:uncharacterized protein DUF3467
MSHERRSSHCGSHEARGREHPVHVSAESVDGVRGRHRHSPARRAPGARRLRDGRRRGPHDVGRQGQRVLLPARPRIENAFGAIAQAYSEGVPLVVVAGGTPRNRRVNKSWERGPQQNGLDIELNHRIVLSPFAAKRLSALLQQLMKEYEGRYGALSE